MDEALDEERRRTSHAEVELRGIEQHVGGFTQLIGSLQDAYALARKSVTALQHDRVADRIGACDGFIHRFRERIGRHGNAERTRG